MNIITYWTFDMFHIWHLNLLKRCRDLAWDDKFIIWISSDEFNKLKNKETIIPLEQRMQIIESLDLADEIIIENTREQKKEDMLHYQAKLVMGSDWVNKFDEYDCIYLCRTKDISTTDIKKKIIDLYLKDKNANKTTS